MSTNINLVVIVAKIKDIQKENKKDIYILFMDLKRAFYNVGQKVLFDKIEKMPLDKKIIKKVNSYPQMPKRK
jgi:hypothetical protein